jgi:hypothetical protein
VDENTAAAVDGGDGSHAFSCLQKKPAFVTEFTPEYV